MNKPKSGLSGAGPLNSSGGRVPITRRALVTSTLTAIGASAGYFDLPGSSSNASVEAPVRAVYRADPQQGVTSNEVKYVPSSSAVRAFTMETSDSAVFIGGGDGGLFRYDPSDTISRGDGGAFAGTVIVDAASRRWKRADFNGTYLHEWYGAVGDGITDDTHAVNSTIAAVPQGGGVIALLPDKMYCLTSPPLLNKWALKIQGKQGYWYVSGRPRSGYRCNFDNKKYFLNPTARMSFEHIVIDMNGKNGWAVGSDTDSFRLIGCSVADAFNGVKMYSASVIDRCNIRGRLSFSDIQSANDGSVGIKTDSDSRIIATEVETGFQYGCWWRGGAVYIGPDCYFEQCTVGMLIEGAAGGQAVGNRYNRNWSAGIQVGRANSTREYSLGWRIVGAETEYTGLDLTDAGNDNGSAVDMVVDSGEFVISGAIEGFDRRSVFTSSAGASPLSLKTSGWIRLLQIYDSNFTGVAGKDALDIRSLGDIYFYNSTIRENGSVNHYIQKRYKNQLVRDAIRVESDGALLVTINGQQIAGYDSKGVSFCGVGGSGVVTGYPKVRWRYNNTERAHNRDSTETILHSLRLDADVLNIPNGLVEYVGVGTAAANQNTKTIFAMIDDTKYGTFVLAPSQESAWKVKITIIALSDSEQNIEVEFLRGGKTSDHGFQVARANMDSSVAHHVMITAVGGASRDISQISSNMWCDR